MTTKGINFIPYLAIVAMFLGHGDGTWKEKDKETIKQDLRIFRQIADEIEQKIEDFYDEYSDVVKSVDKNERTQNQTTQFVSFLNRDTKENFDKQFQMKTEGQIIRNDLFQHQTVNNEPCCNNIASRDVQGPDKGLFRNQPIGWPKFDDMLLAIGKKYDWKNDRWIKVKQKDRSDEDSNSISFKEKHHFSYRIVKLNRSKSRRNVVIAVKAVR